MKFYYFILRTNLYIGKVAWEIKEFVFKSGNSEILRYAFAFLLHYSKLYIILVQ